VFVPCKPFQDSIAFVGWQEPTQVKRLSGASLYGIVLALPTNNSLGWKGLPGANTLAYCKYS